jgi:carbon storage regulator
MLVLTRKKNEMIRIGNDIVVKVISTGRGKVKLGIEAPAHVRVLRAELASAVQRCQPAGSSSQTDQPQILA